MKRNRRPVRRPLQGSRHKVTVGLARKVVMEVLKSSQVLDLFGRQSGQDLLTVQMCDVGVK